MEIRKLARDRLKVDNEILAERLMPWDALNAPFEGSYCLVAPGCASGAHSHHEYELWVAMSGRAEVVTDDGTVPFAAGDVIHFAPHERHQVVNRGVGDFHMYAVWWDAGLAERFTERQRAA